MFYFLIAPVLMYNWFLILAAVVPAIFLMIKVYRADRLEAENPAFLRRLVLGGVIATLIAMVIERVGSALLAASVPVNSTAYNVILYFVIVGFAEEGAKYFMLKKWSWNSAEFNCQYDAVVYAVFVSLGFALWENISYVTHFGFGAALVRAVTAVPGHTCFGVFMGAFYGLARGYAYLGENGKSKLFRVLAVIIPAAIHGAYDYIASTQESGGTFAFLAFILILFTASFVMVNNLSKNDKYFNMNRQNFTF